MSGTSLDGLDIAFCTFSFKDELWHFDMTTTTTEIYPEILKNKLSRATLLPKNDIKQLDIELGRYFGEKVLAFIRKNNLSVDFIASHGHTIFHQPEKKFNLQIGNPNVIRQITNLPVVADFRTKNILSGGQGAPLVPIGDKLLFHEYDVCINLGGFSNISFDDENGQRRAFDICPVNTILNHLALKSGFEFDENGNIGKQGKINSELLHTLNSLPYYQNEYPKSLGNEWLDKEFLPILDNFQIALSDKMRTVYEHIIVQLNNAIPQSQNGKVLFSGGGTHNEFLMSLLKSKIFHQIYIPGEKIIDYKEALIFAFLGVLSKLQIPNCLASYSGAPEDMICGKWFY